MAAAARKANAGFCSDQEKSKLGKVTDDSDRSEGSEHCVSTNEIFPQHGKRLFGEKFHEKFTDIHLQADDMAFDTDGDRRANRQNMKEKGYGRDGETWETRRRGANRGNGNWAKSIVVRI
ncbi:hypothetical protein AXG93_1923s1320 [Marchantia polymorpha subsp. ruderalis]|uniref:Uncharacterized protein n=1 Tax=Marchantia polymorpha subsp. ruderalis TaxID=1480154 RepID=A0A176VFK1_MARPO|nr:hypothetical protein AXG93_1923s1320 [Marchantia polymorpha subsp. ruderalis]